MDKKRERKQIAKISVFITSIFVIFLSVTYAFINMTLTGTKRQVITAGNLELELLEDDNNLTIANAMPMYDEVGMIQDAFTFRLVNKTSTNTNYILKLVDITTGEKLDTSIVKYGLTKDGERTIKYLSNLINGQIDKGTINGGQTIEYSLRLWIDSGVEASAVINGKTLSYRIDVVAEQEIVRGEPGGTLKEFKYDVPWNSPVCDEDFCRYSNNIKALVFENKIDVPSNIDENLKWDLSEAHDGSVMVFLEENGTFESGKTAYKVHFQGDNGIYANPNSSVMFSGLEYVESIEGLEYFDTSKVTNMSGMFYSCSSLTSLDLSGFDTSGVTTMSEMFVGCRSLISLDLSSFDTSSVTNMYWMFWGCNSLESLDLSNFNTTNVTDMSGMFGDVKNDCLITVKDEATKAWVKEQNNELTNVQVKSA